MRNWTLLFFDNCFQTLDIYTNENILLSLKNTHLHTKKKTITERQATMSCSPDFADTGAFVMLVHRSGLVSKLLECHCDVCWDTTVKKVIHLIEIILLSVKKYWAMGIDSWTFWWQSGQTHSKWENQYNLYITHNFLRILFNFTTI